MQRNTIIATVALVLILLAGGIFWLTNGRANAANAATPEAGATFDVDPAYTVPGRTDATDGSQPAAGQAPAATPAASR